ncbi:MAG: hypothetical protein AAGD06_23635 [Acidobacteriota bacterium]
MSEEALEEAATLVNIYLEKERGDLVARPNPRGGGILVHTQLFQGIWVVKEKVAFPLNSASQQMTPSLIVPPSADRRFWSWLGVTYGAAQREPAAKLFA